MAGSAPSNSWIPLDALGSRFLGNVQALAGRLPELAEALKNLTPRQTYFILPITDSIQLGVGNGVGVTPMPQSVPAPVAKNLIRQLYPSATCHLPVLISGEDMGWLWNGIYRLPCQTPALPGHQPPLYFLIKEIERLWVILHLHDWRDLLADPRVRLFAGDDAFERFRGSLISEPVCPWPRLSVQVDPTLWNGRPSLDEIIAGAMEQANQELHRCTQQFQRAYSGATPETISSHLASGRPLKVLGITSRFTTFLQYSMRDWLASFERLGHQTRLIIEDHDHEMANSLTIASACAEFQPDLIIIIDHYRAELGGLPEQVPMVMWVQDALPNIFRREAGKAQGPLDYVLGFARLDLVHEFGYPADRFMSAVIGCDEMRFAPGRLSPSEQAEFGCDVSFVSHASTPADVLLQTEIDRAGSVEAERLLREIYEQLSAVYQDGGFLTEPIEIRRMIDRALVQTKTSIAESEMPKLVDLFTQKINNALFRHQSLNWLAEMGVDLRLYGRGWEKHPTLSRFARGIADNSTQLAQIYRASRISLHASPHGAVHQRLMEGLACGGFFLLRRCSGDLMERRYQTLWNWCVSKRILSDSQLRGVSEPRIAQALAQAASDLRLDPFAMRHSFIEELRASAQGGYIRSAGMIWGEDYDAVAYGSADELRVKIAQFLGDENERRRIADSMRAVVLARFSYSATTSRLLNFMAEDLANRNLRKAAA
jgi:glycosyltransferase involved in cell wall biosynthesis